MKELLFQLGKYVKTKDLIFFEPLSQLEFSTSKRLFENLPFLRDYVSFVRLTRSPDFLFSDHPFFFLNSRFR